jgi:hypothetical protein
MITVEIDGREWFAVSFLASTGEFVWIPADTDLIVAPALPTEAEPQEGEQLTLDLGDA